MKSQDYRDVIVFENLRFQNVFWPQENTSLAFSNSSGMKRIFEKFFFREGLAGMVGLTVEIKLRLQNLQHCVWAGPQVPLRNHSS